MWTELTWGVNILDWSCFWGTCFSEENTTNPLLFWLTPFFLLTFWKTSWFLTVKSLGLVCNTIWICLSPAGHGDPSWKPAAVSLCIFLGCLSLFLCRHFYVHCPKEWEKHSLFERSKIVFGRFLPAPGDARRAQNCSLASELPVGIKRLFLSAAREALHPGSNTNELWITSLPHRSCGMFLDFTLVGGNTIEQPDNGGCFGLLPYIINLAPVEGTCRRKLLPST